MNKKEENKHDCICQLCEGKRQGYNKALADMGKMNKEKRIEMFMYGVGVGMISIGVSNFILNQFYNAVTNSVSGVTVIFIACLIFRTKNNRRE